MKTPNTCVNIRVLEDLLTLHPDKQFVDYLVSGMKAGLQYVPTESLECRNLLSSRDSQMLLRNYYREKWKKDLL